MNLESTTNGRTAADSNARTGMPGGMAPVRTSAAKAPISGAGLDALLENVHSELKTSGGDPARVDNAMEELFLTLQALRNDSTEAQWCELVERCRQHPLRSLIHEDPFTHRAFSKPRGYAGDAEMIDYIYAREEDWPLPAASPVGRAIFDYTTRAPASKGVRARRGYMADVIDDMARDRTDLQALSIAAGHLREAGMSSAVRQGKLQRLVALDADAVSLEHVERTYGRYNVETVPAHLRRLLTNRLDVGQFDLVYSTGLFDYLAEATARRMVTCMFNLLRPGGRLVVANFMENVRDIGYMEVFMDWQLIYRNRRQMIELTSEIPEVEVRESRVFAESNQNIIFLEVEKQR